MVRWSVYGRWSTAVSGARRKRQSIRPCPFRGTMAGEHYGASSGLPQLGGIREEPGAVAVELEPRGEPRGAAGRKRPAAGNCLLWRLRPEDERSKPGSERQAVAFVYLRARLSGWRR